jgi:hypothetical protein
LESLILLRAFHASSLKKVTQAFLVLDALFKRPRVYNACWIEDKKWEIPERRIAKGSPFKTLPAEVLKGRNTCTQARLSIS